MQKWILVCHRDTKSVPRFAEMDTRVAKRAPRFEKQGPRFTKRGPRFKKSPQVSENEP